jgi:hypothetical protein
MSDACERAAERAEAETQRQRRERAARGERMGFRIHATVFVAVQLMLVLTWAVTGLGYPWFVFPLAGWGVGLAAHYAVARDALRTR